MVTFDFERVGHRHPDAGGLVIALGFHGTNITKNSGFTC